jgi:hypothetical protein
MMAASIWMLGLVAIGIGAEHGAALAKATSTAQHSECCTANALNTAGGTKLSSQTLYAERDP